MCMYKLEDVMFLCVINYKPNNQVPVLKGSLEKLHLICQKKAFSSSIKRKPCFPFLVGCSFPVEFYRRVSDIYCFLITLSFFVSTDKRTAWDKQF